MKIGLKSVTVDVEALKDKTAKNTQSIQDLFMLEKADVKPRTPVTTNMTGDLNENVMQMLQDLENELA